MKTKTFIEVTQIGEMKKAPMYLITAPKVVEHQGFEMTHGAK